MCIRARPGWIVRDMLRGGDEARERQSMYCALHPSCFVAIYSAFSAPLRLLYLALYISSPTHQLQVFVACRQRELLVLRCYFAFRPPLGPSFAHRFGVASAASATLRRIVITFRRWDCIGAVHYHSDRKKPNSMRFFAQEEALNS